MNSMTGYGRGEATNGDVSVVVEMKSVNNRFRDLNIRLPREYLVVEPRLQQLLKGRIQRGRIDVFVRRSTIESAHSVSADTRLAERYFEAMATVAKRLQRDQTHIPLSLVLEQPGVLTQVEQEADGLAEWNLVSTAVEAALEDLIQMRGTEGGALLRDLQSHLDTMLTLRAEVETQQEGIAARLRDRLDRRIRRLVGDRVDSQRLAQEAAILADKADVSEELARIQSHCHQFQEALGAQEPVGRKLDFLLQELNREINTIGSKAAEHPVANRVVEMKSVLERMREQAANVE